MDKNTSWYYFSPFLDDKTSNKTSSPSTDNFFPIYWTYFIFYIWKGRGIFDKRIRTKAGDYRSNSQYYSYFDSSLASAPNLFAYKFFSSIMEKEYVVLVDKNNKVLGFAPKLEAHNNNTPLHRGFSLFLFNKKGELILQQRSNKKKTWPLVWSNSCCGHPMFNESNVDAAKRRLQFELGISDVNIFEIISSFQYKVKKDGIVENEICPILIGFSNQEPRINKDEVENIKWISWEKFINDLNVNSSKYSPWCILEADLLKNNKKFLKLYKQFTS